MIFGLAALIMPLDTLAYSFLGAAVFSLFLVRQDSCRLPLVQYS